MSNDDDPNRARHGAGLPGFSTLAEVFGAAVDGASRMTRTRARHLAERLLSQAGFENVDLGEAASGASARINQLAEEIMAARKANRTLLQRTVTQELEKSLHRLGLAAAEDVQQMREEISRLRDEVAGLRAAATAAADTPPGDASPAPRSTKRSASATTGRATTKKTGAAKTSATKSAGAGSRATKSGASKSGASRTGAGKTGATRPAKKAGSRSPRKTTAPTRSETQE